MCHMCIRASVWRDPTGVCLRDAIRDFGRLLFTAIFVFILLTKGINNASCWISPVNGSIGSAPTRKLPFFPKRNGENLPLWANCANAMNRSSALVRRGLPAQPRSQLTPARLPDLCILRNHCVICCRRLVTFRPPCQIIAIFRRNTC